MNNDEVREARERDEVFLLSESDQSRRRTDDAAWGNSRILSAEISGNDPSISANTPSFIEVTPILDNNIRKSHGQVENSHLGQLEVDVSALRQPQTAHFKSEAGQSPAIENRISQDDIDTVAWNNARIARRSDNLISENDNVQKMIERAQGDVERAFAEQPVNKLQLVEGARSAVEIAFDERDTQLGKPEWEPPGFDAREPALKKFELDSRSATQATEVGRHLATEIPRDNWVTADYDRRRIVTKEAGDFAASELGIRPPDVKVNPDLAEDQFGFSSGTIIEINNRLLWEGEPTDLIETVAHEVRHQWQDAILRGDLEHPLGDDAFHKMVRADICYESDINGRWTYAANYREVDAEAFSRAVSDAYIKSCKERSK